MSSQRRGCFEFACQRRCYGFRFCYEDVKDKDYITRNSHNIVLFRLGSIWVNSKGFGLSAGVLQALAPPSVEQKISSFMIVRRPRMSERRLEPAREHQLAEARQAPPEASAGSFQAARIPDRAVGALVQGVPLSWAYMPSLRAATRTVEISGSKVQVGKACSSRESKTLPRLAPFRGGLQLSNTSRERESDWSLFEPCSVGVSECRAVSGQCRGSVGAVSGQCRGSVG